MSPNPFIGLVPLGPVEPRILQHLSTTIAGFFLLPVKILSPQPLPPQTYHLVRNQYHSTGLLEYLLNLDQGEPFRILGITAVDLYIPIFTFVFGEAQLDGRAALISCFRPGGGASDVRPPQPLFLERLSKLCIHELGHTFNLPHCRQNGCLMGFSANLEKLDQKKLGFCKYCHILLDDFFQAIDGLTTG